VCLLPLSLCCAAGGCASLARKNDVRRMRCRVKEKLTG
jgi:hypothetical protein